MGWKRYSGMHLVFLGGMLGTLARYLVELIVPVQHVFPVDILTINALGAFILALVVGSIINQPTRRQLRMRLFIGSGMMGGFTTYSTLAVQSAGFLLEGHTALAAVYSLGTVLLGGVATIAGLFLGRRMVRRFISEDSAGDTQ